MLSKDKTNNLVSQSHIMVATWAFRTDYCNLNMWSLFCPTSFIQNLCWFWCPSLHAAVCRIWNSWPEVSFKPVIEIKKTTNCQNKLRWQLPPLKQTIWQWSNHFSLEKQILIIVTITIDRMTPATVMMITIVTASESKEKQVAVKYSVLPHWHFFKL